MKIDIEFLQSQFQTIKETYGLEWEDLDEYGGILKNNLIEISAYTEPYDDEEDGISLLIRDVIKKEDYFIFELGNPFGFRGSIDYFTEEEKLYSKTLGFINSNIYSARVLLERYCQDVLSGDFSQVGPGMPDDDEID